MKAEELLALLKERGMDEEAMEMLLAEAIKAIHPHEEMPCEEQQNPEEEDKAKAAKLLGVDF